MRTISALSNITWNTPEYLKMSLDKLLKHGDIDFWCFVLHHAEPDEIFSDDAGDKKDHIHLFMQPSKCIDTFSLKPKFAEFIPGESLPRQPTGDWRRSKFEDWFLYASHDIGYLAKKGIVRKYHYLPSDFITSDQLAFRGRLDLVPNVFGAAQAIIAGARTGVSWSQLVTKGLVPLANYKQAKELYGDASREYQEEQRQKKFKKK